jgi:hypothetical protein
VRISYFFSNRDRDAFTLKGVVLEEEDLSLLAFLVDVVADLLAVVVGLVDPIPRPIPLSDGVLFDMSPPLRLLAAAICRCSDNFLLILLDTIVFEYGVAVRNAITCRCTSLTSPLQQQHT